MQLKNSKLNQLLFGVIENFQGNLPEVIEKKDIRRTRSI
tara:strand:- start:799 stop:915 length:117 start_codon:yes stop_codon:yes gene_type:complete